MKGHTTILYLVSVLAVLTHVVQAEHELCINLKGLKNHISKNNQTIQKYFDTYVGCTVYNSEGKLAEDSDEYLNNMPIMINIYETGDSSQVHCIETTSLNAINRQSFMDCINGKLSENTDPAFYDRFRSELTKQLEKVLIRAGIAAKSTTQQIVTPNSIIEFLNKLCVVKDIENKTHSLNLNEPCDGFKFSMHSEKAPKETIPGTDGSLFDFHFEPTGTLKLKLPEEMNYSLYVLKGVVFNVSNDYMKFIITSANQEFEFFISRYIHNNYNSSTGLSTDTSPNKINAYLIDEYGPELLNSFNQILIIDDESYDIQALSLPLVVKAFSSLTIFGTVNKIMTTNEAKLNYDHIYNTDFNNLKDLQSFSMTNQNIFALDENGDSQVNNICSSTEKDKIIILYEDAIIPLITEEGQQNLGSNHVRIVLAFCALAPAMQEYIYVDVFSFDNDFYRSVNIKFFSLHFKSEYLIPWDSETIFKQSLQEIFDDFIQHYRVAVSADDNIRSVVLADVVNLLYSEIPQNAGYNLCIKENDGLKIIESKTFTKLEIYAYKSSVINPQSTFETPEMCEPLEKNEIADLDQKVQNKRKTRIVQLFKKDEVDDNIYSLIFSNLQIFNNNTTSNIRLARLNNSSFDFILADSKNQNALVRNFITRTLAPYKKALEARELRSSKNVRSVKKRYSVNNMAFARIVQNNFTDDGIYVDLGNYAEIERQKESGNEGKLDDDIVNV